MKWIPALKIWNAQHNPTKWCVPRKGSPEHAEVKRIMAEGGAARDTLREEEERMARSAPARTARSNAAPEEEEVDADAMFREMVRGQRLSEIGKGLKKGKVAAFLKKALEKKKAKKAAKETRVKEIATKAKRAKVMAFLAKELKKRKEKKGLAKFVIPIGETRVVKSADYYNTFLANTIHPPETAPEIAKNYSEKVLTLHPEKAMFRRKEGGTLGITPAPAEEAVSNAVGAGAGGAVARPKISEEKRKQLTMEEDDVFSIVLEDLEDIIRLNTNIPEEDIERIAARTRKSLGDEEVTYVYKGHRDFFGVIDTPEKLKAYNKKKDQEFEDRMMSGASREPEFQYAKFYTFINLKRNR